MFNVVIPLSLGVHSWDSTDASLKETVCFPPLFNKTFTHGNHSGYALQCREIVPKKGLRIGNYEFIKGNEHTEERERGWGA